MAQKSTKPIVPCPTCGKACRGAHGLAMHNSLTHGNGRKDRPKPKQKAVVLREVYTEGGENGRILLTDQHGNWWVARMLDV